MEKYFVDFLAWGWKALPRPLQKTRHVQWLWAVLSPLRAKHGAQMDWLRATLEDMRWTGQTWSLETMLRIKMQSEGIYLLNLENPIMGAFIGTVVDTPESITKAPDAPGMFISMGGSVGGIRGIIRVPLFLQPKEDIIRALVAKYKIEQGRYRIEYY